MHNPLGVLQQYWGYQAFRPLQEDIIRSVLDKQDTLALLPTGGGKSICFQVPALSQEGMAIVISPLMALMKDQVERLNELGISATYINSSMSWKSIDFKLNLAMQGAYRFLYIAPERIQSDIFRMRLPRMPVNLLVVDEAHCVSQWGHDFRPAYLEIKTIREVIPELPLVALTASATPEVQKDILKQLELRSPRVFSKSFKRENLRYLVIESTNVRERIVDILQKIKGQAIIYARTRKRTEILAKWLKELNFAAAYYHGGMPNSEREKAQQSWVEDKIRIIVATNAFGMGIDKADVRMVIHYNFPSDLESYYQEAGRGGRDGKTALAIAFNNSIDLKELKKWQENKYPEFPQVQEVFELLCDQFGLIKGEIPDKSFDLDIAALAQKTDIKASRLHSILNLLHRNKIISFSEDKDDFCHFLFTCSIEDLLIYKSQHPVHADLLDTILRFAGGEAFTREFKFNPFIWAKNTGLSREDLHKKFLRFQEHHLLEYTPARRQPNIKFLTYKRRLSKSELNWEKIEFLKKQSRMKLDKAIEYLESDNCRSLYIQHYFGEKSSQNCGKCDICSKRNKSEINKEDINSILQFISHSLKGINSIPYPVLLRAGGPGSEAQKKKAIRYLLDKGKITADEEGNISMPK